MPHLPCVLTPQMWADLPAPLDNTDRLFAAIVLATTSVSLYTIGTLAQMSPEWRLMLAVALTGQIGMPVLFYCMRATPAETNEIEEEWNNIALGV